MIDQPTYQQGHIIASSFLIGALIFTFILRFCLAMENRRRKHLSENDYDREANLEEAYDWVKIENIFIKRIYQYFFLYVFSIQVINMCYETSEAELRNIYKSNFSRIIKYFEK